ncbi:interferon-induced, double-stranded RNA-activated protein kinase isoform X2 [Protopterus annectens]|uniref:interferon-induced, double-stranded RNA-activated protein kinase isoform X2 n=1 Tax=Protopterus annectens TaxID=7888 RepID=UPI001CFC1024|nr:interferon-induced, double-stranded RNA-activated protein kinase isoform X2 [Protopterus annectens]
MASASNVERNFIVELREYCDKQSLNFDIKQVSQSGPPHNPTFVYKVQISGKDYPDGSGRNKKEAQNNAARNALQLLKPQSLEHDSAVGSMERSIGMNSISILHEYAAKRNKRIDLIETQEGPSHLPMFYCKWKLDDRVFDCGTGKTKQEAKQKAATLALDGLAKEDSEKQESVSSSLLKACSPGAPLKMQDENHCSFAGSKRSPFMDFSVASDDSFDDKQNFVGELLEVCLKNKLEPRIVQLDQSGPSHCPMFAFRVIIGEKEFPAAFGNSKSSARRRAAKVALEHLMPANRQSNSSHNQKSASSGSWNGNSVNSSASGDRRSSDLASKPVYTTTEGSSVVFRNESQKDAASPASTVLSCAAEKEATTKFVSRLEKDFKDISHLGRGGFGSVRKAKHKLDNKYYAIKQVQLQNSKTLREVKTLADLNHPNIVRYYSSWTDVEHFGSERDSNSCSLSSVSTLPELTFHYLYIQMELCDKGTLFDWIQKNVTEQKIWRQPLHIFMQIVQGVKYIHSKGLIHRDLKPKNIFMADDNEPSVKIGDFGLVTDNVDAKSERTTNKGTEMYMSPEQKNNKNYGEKVDIFPLGLIFFELLWPFKTKMEKAKMWDDIRMCSFPEELISTFGLESKLIKKMLAENPDNRPNPSDILTDAQNFLNIFDKTQQTTL